MVSISEVREIMELQPCLTYSEKLRCLKGTIRVNHQALGEHLVDDFPIKILLPAEYSATVPSVFAPGYEMPEKFAHIFIKDSRLCLGTEADQRFFLLEGHTLNEWLDRYVVPYFFTVEYFRKYGVCPFGERNHGLRGILEYYQELFNAESFEETLQLMNFIAARSYRGHVLCPCNSGKRVRNCHGAQLMKYGELKYKGIIAQDYKVVLQVMQESSRQDARRYNGKNSK
jgi:hypothetical protein